MTADPSTSYDFLFKVCGPIAWLLRYVENHTIYVFVWYRVLLGLFVLLAVMSGAVAAT